MGGGRDHQDCGSCRGEKMIWGKEGRGLHGPNGNLEQWKCGVDLRFTLTPDDSCKQSTACEKVTSACCSCHFHSQTCSHQKILPSLFFCDILIRLFIAVPVREPWSWVVFFLPRFTRHSHLLNHFGNRLNRKNSRAYRILLMFSLAESAVKLPLTTRIRRQHLHIQEQSTAGRWLWRKPAPQQPCQTDRQTCGGTFLRGLELASRVTLGRHCPSEE